MLIVAGIIVAVSGIGRLIILLTDWRHDQRIYRTGTIARAVIVDRITYPDADDLQSSQYRLIARFTDHSGESRFVRSRGHVCGSESRELQGKSTEVFYLPENPEQARFLWDKKDHISYWSLAWSLAAVAAGLILIALFYFFSLA